VFAVTLAAVRDGDRLAKSRLVRGLLADVERFAHQVALAVPPRQT
jgi:hypothetical protein